MNKKAKNILYTLRYPCILAVVMLVLTLLKPGVFNTWGNFSGILWAVAVIGIMTTGTICVILLGGIDLAVGSVSCLSGIILVFTIMNNGYTTQSVVMGCALALLTGAAIGMIHGVLVTAFAVPAFLITMASQTVINGVAIALTGGETFGLLKPDAFLAIGTGYMPIGIMLVMAAISYFILNHTVYGRELYAVGGNPEASDLSGIRSKLVTVMAYTFSGLTASLGGIVLSSKVQQASSLMARGYEMDVLTAIVVGGTSLFGGEGTIQGALFGALLVGLINNGLTLMDAPTTYHSVAKGIVIVTAVAIDFYAKSEKKAKKQKRLPAQ
ncbi:MAG: ABC transporter permease [Eubacteriales bacterium]|jgi:ribose transport system permease protein